MENGRIDIIMRAVVAALKLNVMKCVIQSLKQLHSVDCEGPCNSQAHVYSLEDPWRCMVLHMVHWFVVTNSARAKYQPGQCSAMDPQINLLQIYQYGHMLYVD